MATLNQTLHWPSGQLIIEGTTSGREIVKCSGDNVSLPPLRGRVNSDLFCAGTSGGICANILNPTTETLYIDKIILNIETASSSSSFLYVGVANTAGSSATNLCNGLVKASSVWSNPIALQSSNVFPVSWGSTRIVTVFMQGDVLVSSATAMDGTISVFYVAEPNT